MTNESRAQSTAHNSTSSFIVVTTIDLEENCGTITIFRVVVFWNTNKQRKTPPPNSCFTFHAHTTILLHLLLNLVTPMVF